MKTKTLWTVLLVPQFALLLLSVWSDCRHVAYQLRNGEPYTIGCTVRLGISEVMPTMAMGIFGLVTILGLLAFRPWARSSYSVLVAILLMISTGFPFDELIPVIIVCAAWTIFGATLFLCFSRSLSPRFQRQAA